MIPTPMEKSFCLFGIINISKDKSFLFSWIGGLDNEASKNISDCRVVEK